MAILKTENLTYVYSQGTPFEKTAVNNVSIEIEKGEFTGIIGHTGSASPRLFSISTDCLSPRRAGYILTVRISGG